MSISKPLVTAVMLTGVSPRRYPMARVAVESWQEQTYQNRELVIINEAGPQGEPLFETPPAGVREYMVVRPPKVGDLRNMAFDYIEKGCMIQWDDDDFSHPDRIAFQVDGWQPGRANVLTRQLQYNLLTGDVFICAGRHWKSGGLPGTILHPREAPIRYPSISIFEDGCGEDSAFAVAFRRGRKLDSLNNSPKYYVRFYHGMNSCSQHHMMDIHAGRFGRIKAEHKVYLANDVLPRYETIRRELIEQRDLPCPIVNNPRNPR